MSAGTVNTPSPDVTVENVSPVRTFLMVTVAPGMTAPSASTATPEMVPVEEPCAKAVALGIRQSKAAKANRTHPFVISNPYGEMGVRKASQLRGQNYAVGTNRSSPVSA